MPLLQVRDVPAGLYETLARIAESENRSIDQQTIILLKKALGYKEERSARRKRVLQEIKKLELGDTNRFPDPAALIREGRGRYLYSMQDWD